MVKKNPSNVHRISNLQHTMIIVLIKNNAIKCRILCQLMSSFTARDMYVWKAYLIILTRNTSIII